MNQRIIDAAEAAHEVNRCYCAGIGDDSQLPWSEAPTWQRQSAINGAYAISRNPDLTPEQSHESWMAEKEAHGWVYGEEKDEEKKTHPCVVDYEELPQEQRAKDHIFGAVVRRMLGM